MKIILSPAKKMNVDTDKVSHIGEPVFLDKTEKILGWLKGQSEEALKKLWKCNDKITVQNVERLEHMNLYEGLTPAVLAYEGLAYQYMAPAVFEDGHLDYVQEHLRILSGFYGVLKAMDGVTPYRLEMQAKAPVEGAKDLYEFWGSSLYEEVIDGDRVIVNLASKEYSKCIEKYLTPEDTYITCTFCEMVNGKLAQKGTYAKMARGEMVRFMAEHQIKDVQEMKKFDRLGYVFREDISDEKEYIFERKHSEDS